MYKRAIWVKVSLECWGRLDRLLSWLNCDQAGIMTRSMLSRLNTYPHTVTKLHGNTPNLGIWSVSSQMNTYLLHIYPYMLDG